MPMFLFKTNHEPVKCVNCGNDQFVRRQSLAQADGELVPYECQRCHFISWFPADFAPEQKPDQAGGK